MKNVLKNRNFQLLFMGNLVSQIGQSFFGFAIGWYILTLTESPFQAGLFIAINGLIQTLLVPFLSVYADRWHKGRILFATDLVRGIFILIAGILIFQFNDVYIIMAVLYSNAVIMAIAHAFFSPAAMAIIPEIVGDEHLREAMSLNGFVNSIQQLTGVLLAGFTYALLGIVGIFILTGVAFILSAISELFIHLNHQKPDTTSDFKSYLNELSFGLKYLLQTTGLKEMLILIILLNFSIAPVFSNIYPYVFNIVLNRPPFDLSLASAALSMGTLIGGVSVGVLSKNISIKQAMKGGILATFFILLVHHLWLVMGAEAWFSYSLFFPLFLAILFVFGWVNMWINIPFNTGLTKAIEPSVRGRVLGLVSTVAQGLIPVAIFLTGLLLETTSVRIVLIILTVVGFLPFMLFLKSKAVNALLGSLKENQQMA